MYVCHLQALGVFFSQVSCHSLPSKGEPSVNITILFPIENGCVVSRSDVIVSRRELIQLVRPVMGTVFTNRLYKLIFKNK